MTEERFKFAKTKGEIAIFPHPVNKGNKYLIKPTFPLQDKGLEVLMSALNNGSLLSPQQDPAIYRKVGLHEDGQTPVYELPFEGLHFHFLSDKSVDPKKGEAIEKVLSKKVVALMSAESEEAYSKAYNDFKKRFEAQTRCSTCQKMGIQSPKLRGWVESLEK